MKTVQQWLNELEERDVVNSFVSLYPPELWRIKAAGITVSEAYGRLEQALYRFIEQLKELTPSSQEKMVFFACPDSKDSGYGCAVRLISAEELSADPVRYYGWMTTPRAEIMGFQIAETRFTLEHLPELIATILNEASFLGFREADFEKNRADLISSLEAGIKDAEEGHTFSAEELWDHLGIPRPEKDTMEDEYRDKLRQAQNEYDIYCLNREFKAVKELLKEEPLSDQER